MNPEGIYLDNNATTPVTPEVLTRMVECWRSAFANPGSQHDFGRKARIVLDNSRECLAELLDADPSELVFTSGGTESLNMAIYGLTAGRRGKIALSDGEHPSVMQACLRTGLERVSLPVDSEGKLRHDFAAALPWSELRLVCLILAHNETGVIQDVTQLSQLCQQHGVPLLLDAVQAVGKIDVRFRELGAAALAFGAHKFHGPRGAGGLLLRRGIRIPPLLEGGHQESGRRAGTEPVPLIAGMARALEQWSVARDERERHVRGLRDLLESELLQRCQPAIIHGRSSERLPNTLSIAFPGVSGEALLVNLHLAGIACSLGSACASGSAEPAPVLLAMGVPLEICRSTLRFSLSFMNTEIEIREAVLRIDSVISRMRAEAVGSFSVPTR